MTDKPDLRQVLEHWAQIDDHLWLSRTGLVYSRTKRRLLRCAPNRDGYPTVWHKGKGRYLHELMLTTFVGPRPIGAVARHLNDIPGDNRVENLEWGSRAENIEDAKRNGRQIGARGERHSRARLTEVQVREIRAFRTYGFTVPAIAEWYGMSTPSISDIIHGRRWTHVR